MFYHMRKKKAGSTVFFVKYAIILSIYASWTTLRFGANLGGHSRRFRIHRYANGE